MPLCPLSGALGRLLDNSTYEYSLKYSSSIIGPALGGALAQPCKNYPGLFPHGSVLEKYPFLLPNLVCAAILSFGVVFGILFLEETHQKRKFQHDAGIEAGKWLLTRLRRPYSSSTTDRDQEKLAEGFGSLMGEKPPDYSIAEDEELPGYRTTEGTPRQSSSRSLSPIASHVLDPARSDQPFRNMPRGAKKAFNKQVVLNIVGFGILA